MPYKVLLLLNTKNAPVAVMTDHWCGLADQSGIPEEIISVINAAALGNQNCLNGCTLG